MKMTPMNRQSQLPRNRNPKPKRPRMRTPMRRKQHHPSQRPVARKQRLKPKTPISSQCPRRSSNPRRPNHLRISHHLRPLWPTTSQLLPRNRAARKLLRKELLLMLRTMLRKRGSAGVGRRRPQLKTTERPAIIV